MRRSATGLALVTALLVALAAGGAAAQAYKIGWYSINSGGGAMTGGGMSLNGSVGQPTVGFSKSVSLLNWTGFWGGDVPAPTVLPMLSDAKLLPDGAYVSIAGKIATSGAGDYTGFFYVEELDRHSGIRVAVPNWPVSGLAEGSVVNVIGTVGTTTNGERQLTAPIVVITSTAAPLRPLGMNNAMVGGSTFGAPPLGQTGTAGGTGLSNVGLLVKTWGMVTASGQGVVILDDGSGRLVTVDVSTLASPPAVNSYVSMIGVSSVGTGYSALILPRRESDKEPR